MILLRRGTALFFFLLFTLSILAMGIYGYRALSGGDVGEYKALAERFLYISIIGVSLVAVSFLVAAGKTLSIYRQLDKMIELNKRRDFSPELSMKKLGRIGEKITLLYFTLNSLNEKKTLKISALSGLAEFLAENVHLPIFVTDVQGKIVYVSSGVTEQAGKNRSELLNQNALVLFPEVPYRDVVLELDKRKSPVEVGEARSHLTLIGIQNHQNELSYVVWVFDKGINLPVGAKKNRIRRLLDRRQSR